MAEQPELAAEEDPSSTEPPTEVQNDPSTLESGSQEPVEPAIEESEGHPAAPDGGGRIARWAKRRSIRQIKRALAAGARRPMPWDVRENVDTRLPDGESVQLAGLTLLEAFPPSIITALDRSIRDLPDGAGIRKQEIRRHLAQSRRGASHGSSSIGMVRHPGSFIGSNGWHDQDLPEPVDAVSLEVHYRTPSLAIVSAVFTMKEGAGDLSSLIREDAHVQAESILELPGRLAWLRKHIPWSKPKNYRAYNSRTTASGRKAELCEAHISEIQSQCHEWLADRFRGLFAKYGVTRRPAVRVLLTEEMTPFNPGRLQYRPVILGERFNIWRSDDPDWALHITWPSGTEQNIMTFAARRRDVEVEHVPPGTEQTNWSIMQSFEDDHLALIIRYELVPLLATYSETLSVLRDKAGTKRRFRHPVKEARILDDFMVRDGLDAASIARDIHSQTREVREFKLELATFTEDLSEYPESYRQKRKATDFSEQLFEQLRQLISELTADTEVVTANIRASADLRQAIANTRLQRAAVALSVCALIAAIVSVVISLHPH